MNTNTSTDRNFGFWVLFTLAAFTASFIMGFYSYMHQLNFSFWNSLYATLRLFTLNTEVPPSYQGNLPKILEVARLIAAVVVVSNVLATFYYIFKQTFRDLRSRYLKKDMILIGVTEGTYHLAKNLRDSGKTVVVIEQDRTNPYLPELIQNQVGIVIGDATNSATLKRAGFHKAKDYVVFTESDTANVEITLVILDYLRQAKNPEIKGHIHLTETHYKTLLMNQIEKLKASLGPAFQMDQTSLSFFNLNELKAKLLFIEHPLHSTLSIYEVQQKQPHLLLLGFGDVGRYVAIEAIKKAHYLATSKLKLTIVDQNATHLESIFRAGRPSIDSCCDLQFLQKDVHSSEFKQFVQINKDSFTYAVIAFNDDDLEFTAAANLSDLLFDIPIAVRVSQAYLLGKSFSQNQEHFSNVFHFGESAEVANETHILRNELVHLAETLHEEYQTLQNKGVKEDDAAITEWKAIDLFKRESNIALAEHIDTKLFSLGLERSKSLLTKQPLTKEEWQKRMATSLESMAEVEHRRWNAFHFLNGWSQMAPNLQLSQNPKLKQHCCLVDWVELDGVSMARSLLDSPIDYKVYDRQYIESIYDILRNTGYHIYPFGKEVEVNEEDCIYQL